MPSTLRDWPIFSAAEDNMAKIINPRVRKLSKKLVEQAKNKHYKKKYTKAEIKSVGKEVAEEKLGILRENNDGTGKKIKTKKAAVAKGLNIADAKAKKKKIKLKIGKEKEE